MKIVCISGKAQHGKDTTASVMKTYLQEQGHSVLIAHFGDLVKYVCTKFFDWDGQKDQRGRTILQYVGTDIVRTQRPNFWVEFIESVITLFKDEWDFVLLPDCRFPNEFECFKNVGLDVTLVRIERSNFESPLNDEQQQHPSETAMDGYQADYFLDNNSSLIDLEQSVRLLSKQLLQ